MTKEQIIEILKEVVPFEQWAIFHGNWGFDYFDLYASQDIETGIVAYKLTHKKAINKEKMVFGIALSKFGNKIIDVFFDSEIKKIHFNYLQGIKKMNELGILNINPAYRIIKPMTTQEISTQKGVPMPEICQLLDWQTPTNFVWYKDKLHLVVMLSETSFTMADYKTGTRNGYLFSIEGQSTYHFAPQIHEILAVLPKEIPQEQGYRNEITMSFCFNKWFVGYSSEKEIEHENLLEALALLYLHLKV